MFFLQNQQQQQSQHEQQSQHPFECFFPTFPDCPKRSSGATCSSAQFARNNTINTTIAIATRRTVCIFQKKQIKSFIIGNKQVT